MLRQRRSSALLLLRRNSIGYVLLHPRMLEYLFDGHSSLGIRTEHPTDKVFCLLAHAIPVLRSPSFAISVVPLGASDAPSAFPASVAGPSPARGDSADGATGASMVDISTTVTASSESHVSLVYPTDSAAVHCSSLSSIQSQGSPRRPLGRTGSAAAAPRPRPAACPLARMGGRAAPPAGGGGRGASGGAGGAAAAGAG
ncbi:hypothetical protein ACHAWF_000804, partial [Thalassiosira exigua]